MIVIYVVLAGIMIVSIAGYLAMQFWAYQEVRDMKSWSQQARALNAWWIFDKDLLPPEHDHLRITAQWCALAASASSLALWYLWENGGR